MKPVKHIVNSKAALSELIGTARRLFAEHKYYKVTFSMSRDRSLQQNRLFHSWINQIVMERCEDTMVGVKSNAKLHFFVPILRAEDDEFARVYDLGIRPMEEAVKIEAISIVPVTSRCNVDQMSRGLDAMRMHYSALDVDPVLLEWPDEMKTNS